MTHRVRTLDEKDSEREGREGGEGRRERMLLIYLGALHLRCLDAAVDAAYSTTAARHSQAQPPTEIMAGLRL